MSEEQTWSLIIALAVLTLYIVFRVLFSYRNRPNQTYDETFPNKFGISRIVRSAKGHEFDRLFVEASFDERLKAAGMKPETEVTCGPNTFACDRQKGKLLVKTQQEPEGVLLHSRDVLSYALLRDGQVIAQRGRDGGEGVTTATLNSDCERIELRIEARHRDYPHMALVLMPFRFERAEARASAMDAARKIAETLDEVLGERELH